MMPFKTIQVFPSEASAEAPYYITATLASARPRRTLKDGDTFAVLESNGDIVATPGGPGGIFYQDTRYLSHLALLIDEERPLLLGSNMRDDNSALFIDLTNPDLIADQRVVLEKDTVHILRTIFLWRDTAYQRLGVRNYSDRTIDLRLTILFENDFADLFEVRGSRREHRGRATAVRRGDDQIMLIYQGLDDRERRTTVTFDPPPDRLASQRGGVRHQARSWRNAADICCRRMRPNVAASAAVSAQPHRRTPRYARSDPRADIGRNVE